MKPAPADSYSAGFTLIEAMVAVLMMSIILAALATVTGQWLHGWDAGLLRLQRTNLLALGLDRLTEDIASAEYVSAGGGTQSLNENPIFDGSELSVIFVRTTLAPNAGSGLEVVRIAEVSDNDAPVLTRSTAPLPTGGEGPGASTDFLFANPVAVIREPYRISFSYAGPDRVWHERWQNQPQLPEAVRLQVRDAASSMLLAETTSTLVHAELPAHCAWPNSGSQCSITGLSGAASTGHSAIGPGAFGAQ